RRIQHSLQHGTTSSDFHSCPLKITQLRTVKELSYLDEGSGIYLQSYDREGRLVVELDTVSLSLPLTALRKLESMRIKPGDKIAILNADEQGIFVRIRRALDEESETKGSL